MDNPAAREATLVYQNNLGRHPERLEKSVTGVLKLDEILAARMQLANPFFTPE